MTHRITLLTGLILLLWGGELRGAFPRSGLPEGVKLDEFLFPVEGAAADNEALLLPLLTTDPNPAIQAVLGLGYLSTGQRQLAETHCRESWSRGPLFESAYCLSLVAFLDGRAEETEAMSERAIDLRPEETAPYVVLANLGRTRGARDAVVLAMERGMKAVPLRLAFWEWELARILADMGDLDGALQCVGVLTGLRAEDPRPFAQAGDWMLRTDRLIEGAGMFATALQRAPWFVPAAFGRMEALKRLDDLPGLLKAAQAVLDNPDLEDAHPRAQEMAEFARASMYGRRLAELERSAGISLEDLSVLDRLEPVEAVDTLVRAGQVALELRYFQDAASFFQKADSIRPNQPDVLEGLGQVAMEEGQFDVATAHLVRLVALRPTATTLLWIADAAASRGNFDECVSLADRSLTYQRTLSAAWLKKALCHRALRQPKEELAALEEALRLEPTHPGMLREMVSLHLNRSSPPRTVITPMEGLFAAMPSSVPVCTRLSDLYFELGRSIDAAGTMARCIILTPPIRAEERQRRYALLLDKLRSGKDSVLATRTLDRLCEADVEDACHDVMGFRRSGTDTRPLRKTAYRPRGPFVGTLETLGDDEVDFEVVALDVPGFDALSLKARLFLYHMAQAAVAGDRLLYLQNHRHAAWIRDLMEVLFLYREELPRPTSLAVHSYLKRVWLNHGQYDHRSGRKFVPSQLTPAMLLEAMELLSDRGESFGFLPGRHVREKLKFLESSIFHGEFEPWLTVRDGDDPVRDSAVNHYDPGVTTEHLTRIDPEHLTALAVFHRLRGGEVLPIRYAVDGEGGALIVLVVGHLEKALSFAEEGAQAESIRHLIRFYQTGDADAWTAHSVAWLHCAEHTDYLNGFIEQLKDPRSVVGSFEAAASFSADRGLLARLAEDAAWFEGKMPWPQEYKRTDIAPPVSNLAVLVMGTGEMGPIPWLGFNLPNDDEIRATTGSKNVIYSNLLSSRSAAEDRIRDEFFLPELRGPVSSWGATAQLWLVYFHELIGHGSGRMAEGTTAQPGELLGEFFGPLEEARADLVALYALGDAKMEDYGVYSSATRSEFLSAAYALYFQGFLNQYRRFQGGTVREPHQIARQVIFQFLLEGVSADASAFGLQMLQQGENWYVRVLDPERVRMGMSALLAQVQVLKSTGNRTGAEALIVRYGLRYRQDLADNIAVRSARLNLPRQRAYVFPRMVLVKDRKNDSVVDVKLVYDEDLTAQQLRISRQNPLSPIHE
jgi:dipeptidyl-peptidase-3